VVETSLLEHRSAGISGPAPLAETQPVNSFVCTVEITSLEKALSQSIALGGTVVLPNMPIQGVGWLAYVKDPDGNIFGLVQPDQQAA
jgi:predicted enzyme related to lactoylglutathione lyase